MANLVRTNDTVPESKLREIVGWDPDTPLPLVLGVCAGEWRMTRLGHWTFWRNPDARL